MWRPLMVVGLAVSLPSAVYSSEDEFRLLQDLRKSYDPFERPVHNSSLPLTVKIRVYLQQILDVDEKNQVISMAVWLQYAWSDYKLRWSPDEYGGITDIRFPGTANVIWKPDVLLYNSVDDNFDSTYPSNFIVQSDGSVSQVPPGILKSSCKIDITWFPFDDQMCFLKFGSWTYSGRFIDLQIDNEGLNDTHQMDLSYYVVNGEWTLIKTPAIADVKVFGHEPYISIYFFLHIRRRTMYYGLNLIIPSLLISLMTVLGFTLPPDAGEKITLEITILLSVCFFLSMVADMTPPTSEAVPLIGAFFSCCMLVVSASVVFTVLVLNLHFRKPETHRMSPFLRALLIEWLPWVLMMRRPGKKLYSWKGLASIEALKTTKIDPAGSRMRPSDSMSLIRNIKVDYNSYHKDAAYDAQSDKMETPPLLSSDLASPLNNNHHLVGQKQACDYDGFFVPKQPESGIMHTLHRTMQKACVELHQIGGELKFMTKRMREEDEEEDAQNDWRFAAMVIDRLCLYLFTIFIVVSTCGIMFSSPHLQA
uniref:Uncharacterized protein n=1 Tax=Plectus sambesii TaxID=2011161 RepID=A0A914XFN7_9BILA